MTHKNNLHSILHLEWNQNKALFTRKQPSIWWNQLLKVITEQFLPTVKPDVEKLIQ